MARLLAGQAVESTDVAKINKASVVMNGANIAGLISANKDRIAIYFTNNGTNPIFLGLGVTAVTNSGVMIPGSTQVTLTGFTGAVNLIGTNPDRLSWSEV